MSSHVIIQRLRSLTLLLLASGCAGLLCNAAAMAGDADDGPVEKINQAASTAEISVTTLRGGLSALMGSGGNITVLDGPQGKLMVDAGIAVSRPRLSEALMRISDKPVKILIDTHYHWDHTDGNAWIHGLGATIIAHEATVKRLSVPTRVDDWKFTFPVYPAGGLPTVLFKDSKSVSFEGTTVELKYYGLSHTNTDIWAYFVQQDVLSTGDTFWNGVYPFIDNENGGSIDGMIRAANANIKRAGEKTLVVPGHGPVGNRADLIAFRDMLVAIRKNVSTLKSAGKTLQETIAARPTADFDAKWGGYVLDGAFFTKIVYEGL
jgi:glyoxylase-like metal-dependent hydrolase (beta-lactamase superfamily II)